MRLCDTCPSPYWKRSVGVANFCLKMTEQVAESIVSYHSYIHAYNKMAATAQ